MDLDYFTILSARIKYMAITDAKERAGLEAVEREMIATMPNLHTIIRGLEDRFLMGDIDSPENDYDMNVMVAVFAYVRLAWRMGYAEGAGT